MPENTSQKRVLIEKANRTMFAVLAGASALLVFSLITSNGLLGVARHRSEVISEKNKAADQLKENDKAVGELIASFKSFEETPESVLGTNEKNSKIVLDALPPKYDFPALASSLEKILTDGGYTIDSITGIDNSLNESDENSSDPQPIEMPFTITVSGTFDQIKNLPADLERSIRPIHVTSFDLSGKVGDAKLVIEAKTYYKPGKNLDVKLVEVK
jgi:Tfp pilus assembly protein PilO